MSGEPRVVVEELCKRYALSSTRGKLHSLKGALLHGQLWRSLREREGFLALDGVSFSLAAGETLAVIGPNGSGKSTLLKVVAGILQPTSGTVRVRGRLTALIELGAGFHPEISGRDNAVINGMLLGLSRREIEGKLDDIFSFAGLHEFAHEPVKTYSSGMFVRLGFAVATAVDPDILVVDEVLAVGDELFSHRALDRVAELQRRGCAVLLVTHDLALAEKLAHRGLYLNRGRPVFFGPASAAVARYRADVASTQAGEALPQQEGGRRWGNREVVLTAVELLDAQGRSTQVLRSGEACSLRLRYKVHVPKSDFVFGVALHREDGTHVFGTNTHLDGWQGERLEGEGSMNLFFPSLQLAAGRYWVDAAVHSVAGLAYDYACEVLDFLVTAPVPWPGCYAPAHRWIPSGPQFANPPQ
ncbi:MAG: ABC transporter ATP-binding protein [Thermoanaerobaculum sp.]|nr:ABC transporter ATP-binding protein [Thermoanaerobaculum sp.]